MAHSRGGGGTSYNGLDNRQLTIIPRVCVGYEMVDSQRGVYRRVSYNQLISNKREWNNFFIEDTPKMSRIPPHLN